MNFIRKIKGVIKQEQDFYDSYEGTDIEVIKFNEGFISGLKFAVEILSDEKTKWLKQNNYKRLLVYYESLWAFIMTDPNRHRTSYI